MKEIMDYIDYGKDTDLLSNVNIYGLKNALRVSGFPMQENDKIEEIGKMINRGKRLGKCFSQSGEDNYLSGIVVQFDLNCTIKMWTEFQRYHFADIADNKNIEGLIVSGKYVGFTDTYRLAVVKDTRKELSGLDGSKLYPISVLEKLNKAYSMAVLKDGKLAIQVEDEVFEYEPISEKGVFDMKSFINSTKYENYLKANAINKIIYNPVWRMLRLADVSKIRSGFYFQNGKLTIQAYPNEDSKLLLEVLNFDNENINFETLLNIKYINVWFKYIKNEKFEIGLGKDNRSPVSFYKDNLLYVVLPVVSYK